MINFACAVTCNYMYMYMNEQLQHVMEVFDYHQMYILPVLSFSKCNVILFAHYIGHKICFVCMLLAKSFQPTLVGTCITR